MKLAVAVFCALVVGSCAHVPRERQTTSLFLGEWRDSENFRDPPECDDPKVICMSVWADVTFGDVHTISGPRLPESFTATVGFHAETIHKLTVLAAVRTDAQGKRTAWRLDVVLPAESQACFEADDVGRLGIVVPKGTVRRGEQYCVSVTS